MKAVDMGSRVELFVDDYIVSLMEGCAERYVHRPRCEEVVLSDDKPWESSMAYFAVMKDGQIFRMFYRGFHHLTGERPKEAMRKEARGEIMCYADSRDGMSWDKPELGLFEFNGSVRNNIVLGGDRYKYPPTKKWRGYLGRDMCLRGDFVPFKDRSEAATETARYKTLIRGNRGLSQIKERRWDLGLYPFCSPDGLNWTLMSEKPVITKGMFDSQNLAFWDEVRNRYVAFVRDKRGEDPSWDDGRDPEEVAPHQIRDIRMCTSKDFLNWSDPVFINYKGDKVDNLYTSAILPYERAPHIFIAFPTKFYPGDGGSQTAPFFMCSRDGGSTFHIYDKELITRDSPSERDGNRSNYMAHGLVRANNGREYYVYATEGYKDGPSRRLRRFVYRLDGFVSIRCSGEGAVVTRPFVFKGNVLVLNYCTDENGSVRVGIENAAGRPVEGFEVSECSPLSGDETGASVRWKGGASDMKKLEGRDIRIKFLLKNADLFSFRFMDSM